MVSPENERWLLVVGNTVSVGNDRKAADPWCGFRGLCGV